MSTTSATIWSVFDKLQRYGGQLQRPLKLLFLRNWTRSGTVHNFLFHTYLLSGRCASFYKSYHPLLPSWINIGTGRSRIVYFYTSLVEWWIYDAWDPKRHPNLRNIGLLGSIKWWFLPKNNVWWGILTYVGFVFSHPHYKLNELCQCFALFHCTAQPRSNLGV